MPVVDDTGRLVGIITQDDIMDVIQEEATEDAQKMAAMEPLESPYLHSGFWQLIQKRGLWLLLLLVAGLGAGEILLQYEDEWLRYPILALFFPIIIAACGNTGAQSPVLVIRSLALGEVQLADWFKVVVKEWTQGVALGILLGLVLGLIGYARAHFSVGNAAAGAALPDPLQLGASVALSLVLVVTLGTFIGSALPLLFKRVGLDPAIMSTPSIAAAMDVLGLVIFFLTIKVTLDI